MTRTDRVSETAAAMVANAELAATPSVTSS